MGIFWSKTTRESPAMEAIQERYRAAEPEVQKEIPEAKANEIKDTQDSTGIETRQLKARLRYPEMTEHTRNGRPAMDAIQERHRAAAAEPEGQKQIPEAQVNETKDKQDSTGIETRQLKARHQYPEMTEPLRLTKEGTRDGRSAMDAIQERHRATAAEPEGQKQIPEAQVNETKDKQDSTSGIETRQLKSRLRSPRILVSLGLKKERTRGVGPTQWPTQKQFDELKLQYDYSPKKFHIAVSGQSGTGKSSVINSLRGLYPDDQEAAATSDVECTTTVTRYPDADPRKNVVWFDVPGAGTQSHPEAEYFNEKGLYIFDAILVIFGDRFGTTDITILRQCALYNIPSYIVRTKADIHVRNRYDNALKAERRKRGKNLSSGERDRLFEHEKRGFEKATRESVNKELRRAQLPLQPVFIVSSEGLLSAVGGKMSKVANAVIEMEDEGVKNKSEDDNGAQKDVRGGDGRDDKAERDGGGDEDADDDGAEDKPYVVFDEESLLADLMYTSYRTRVAKDSQWLLSVMNSLAKKFPSLLNKVPDGLRETT